MHIKYKTHYPVLSFVRSITYHTVYCILTNTLYTSNITNYFLFTYEYDSLTTLRKTQRLKIESDNIPKNKFPTQILQSAPTTLSAPSTLPGYTPRMYALRIINHPLIARYCTVTRNKFLTKVKLCQKLL